MLPHSLPAPRAAAVRPTCAGLPRRVLPLALGVALLLAACTDGAATPVAYPLPSEAAFASGTCEVIAPEVLALGRAARDLGDGPAPPDAVAEALMQSQQRLQGIAETAEPEVAPLLDAVVTRAGLVRLALAAQRYDPEIGEPLKESYAALVAACTRKGGPLLPATPTATTG